jgi:hypothetical protein
VSNRETSDITLQEFNAIQVTAQMQASSGMTNFVPSLKFVAVESNLHTNCIVALKHIINKSKFFLLQVTFSKASALACYAIYFWTIRSHSLPE